MLRIMIGLASGAVVVLSLVFRQLVPVAELSEKVTPTSDPLEAVRDRSLLGVTRDVSTYPAIRAQLGDHPAIRHFPQTIPSDATDVHFYFRPDFLQGGTSLQLRLTLPREQIDQLYSQFKDQAIRQYFGGDANTHVNLPNGVPTTFFFTSGSETRSFPETYEILVLGAESRGDPDFTWNHGTTYGVAIDVSASVIVFWLEDW